MSQDDAPKDTDYKLFYVGRGHGRPRRNLRFAKVWVFILKQANLVMGLQIVIYEKLPALLFLKSLIVSPESLMAFDGWGGGSRRFFF